MFDYAVSFYENYTVIFYILTIIAVILEGPITVLAIALIAPKLGIGFPTILLFAFIGDYGGDLLHFFIGRFFKGYVLKNKNLPKVKSFFEKIEKFSFFDKLIVIKYTPPITSIGLLYMGFSNVKTSSFMIKDGFLCIISSIILSLIGFYFGQKFSDNENAFIYIFIAIGITLFTIYFLSKLIIKIINKKNKNDS